MSFTVHGSNQPQLVEASPRYNPETRTTTYSYTFRGTEGGIYGLASQFKARGLGYQITHDGPVYTIQTDQPLIGTDGENIDRWEIYTESAEKSIFEHPDVIERAKEFNIGARSRDEDAYHEQIKEVADNAGATLLGATTLDNSLIRHMRAEVTGWQLDLLSIRRTRRIERYLAEVGLRLTLDTGLLLYTTAQLSLPSDIAFVVPATPADDPDGDFKWRWRKRSQRQEYVGQFVEQTVELTFAPWSTLLYDDAGASIAW